jgi:hypothetical protein
VSVNTELFRRLRAFVGLPSIYVANVIEVYADDTSLVQMPGPGSLTAYASNVATGSLVRVRGSGFAAGARVFVRAGVIESEAPAGDIAEIEVGTVVTVQA